MLTGFAFAFALLLTPQDTGTTVPPPPPEVSHAPQPEVPAEDLVKVRLTTAKGDIVLALDRGNAPITTANFLAYVDKGWLDGQPFYRALPYGDGGMIQGGVRDGNKLFDPIAHEPTDQTGILHTAGAISMANAGPGTARNDFFILTVDIPGFDAKEGAPGFAAFGRVIEGMEVVEAIFAEPVDPEKGEGAMKGQLFAEPILIEDAVRVED